MESKWAMASACYRKQAQAYECSQTSGLKELVFSKGQQVMIDIVSGSSCSVTTASQRK